MKKKRFIGMTVALSLAVAAGMGALIACDGDGPTPVSHHARTEPDCYKAGSIEYWEKDGKFYGDEGCTTEITLAETVLAKRDHDFGDDAAYGKDAEGYHWTICAYADCMGTSEKEKHKYVEGECICGATEDVSATKYTVTVNSAEHGTITVDKAEAEEGETVTLTVTAEEGYHIKGIACEDGTEITAAENRYTLVMPANAIKIVAVFEEHTYVNGICECGVTNGFEGFELAQDTSVDIGATRTDTANSFKVSATNPDGQAWRIKVYTVIDNIKLGHYYEITYTLNSNTAGDVYIEINNSAYYKQNFTLQPGLNTVTFRVAVGSEINPGATNPALLLGALPENFEVEITGITYTELTTDLSGYTIGGDPSKVNGSSAYSEDKKVLTIVAQTVEGATAAPDSLKIDQLLPTEEGKTYEITYVFTTDRAENTCFLASNATVENPWNYFDTAGVKVITVRFTATATSEGQYCCYCLGQLLWADGAANLTFTYIELKEVA